MQLGMSSSQLTNSIIFQRGRSTTNQFMSRLLWGSLFDFGLAKTSKTLGKLGSFTDKMEISTDKTREIYHTKLTKQKK